MADDNDQELRIQITTAAQLQAVQQSRKELESLRKQVGKNSEEFEKLTKQIEELDKATKSGSGALLKQREVLLKQQQALRASGVDSADLSKRLQENEEALTGLGVKLTENAAVIQQADKHVKLFGMSHRQLHKAFHSLGRIIPGFNLAIRAMSGGIMAAMAGIMAFGMAVEKVRERIKQINEEMDEFAKEAAKSVTHAAKAHEEAVVEEARAMASLDAELIKITGHQKTLSEQSAESTKTLLEQSKAASEIVKAIQDDELSMLNELHAKKLMTEEEFQRKLNNLKAKFREENRKREEDEEKEVLKKKKEELEALKAEQAELKAKSEEAHKEAAAAKAKLTTKGTLEEHKERLKLAETRRDKVGGYIEAMDKGNMAALPLENQAYLASMAVLGRANEGWSRQKEAFKTQHKGTENEVRLARRELDAFTANQPKLEYNAKFAEESASAARSKYMGNLQRTEALGTEIASSEKTAAIKKSGQAGASNIEAEMRNRQAADNDYRAHLSGQPITSSAKKARTDAIDKAVRSGTITPDTAARLYAMVNAIADAPSQGQMQEMIRRDFDSKSFATPEARESAFKAAVARLPRTPNYQQLYREVDKELGRLKVPLSGFSQGGYTGDGPKDEVAGVVHRGEFVIPADEAAPYINAAQSAAANLSSDVATGMLTTANKIASGAKIANPAGMGLLKGAGKLAPILNAAQAGKEIYDLTTNFGGTTGEIESRGTRSLWSGALEGFGSPLSTIATAGKMGVQAAGMALNQPPSFEQQMARTLANREKGVGAKYLGSQTSDPMADLVMALDAAKAAAQRAADMTQDMKTTVADARQWSGMA